VNKQPTPGQIVVMAAGALALIGSFLPFYSLDTPVGDDDISSWSEGLFPVATLITIFAVIAAFLVALQAFANLRYPAQGVLGFSWSSLLLALTFFSAILAVAFLIQDNGAYDLGIGYFLVLIGGVGSLVGAVMITNEVKRPAGPPTV
jgi:hypothetical protein